MQSQIIEALKKIIENEDAEEDDIAQELQNLVYDIESRKDEYGEGEALSSLLDQNLEIIKNGESYLGRIYTGYSQLDKAINGFLPEELIVIGGRPGMGKTALIINMMLHISKEFPVLYFNLDSSNLTISQRILGMILEIPIEKLRNSSCKDEVELILAEDSPNIHQYKLYFNHHYDKSLNSFKAYCKKEIDSKGIRVIVIDHLQSMSINNFKYNRDQEISKVTAFLKKMASEFNIIIIATSQLSRANEIRGGSKTPQLSDLRESGSIEQNANKVFLIHRPEYYGITETAEGQNTIGLMQIIVAKNDSGNTGDIWLKLLHSTSKIEDLKQIETFSFDNSRLNEFDDEVPF